MEEQVQNDLETKLTGALLDLWQSNSEGSYDVQLADTGGRQLRAKLRADAEGRFRFRTILPTNMRRAPRATRSRLESCRAYNS